MASRVVVFGTGSFAELVHFYLTHDSEHEVVAFTASGDHITAPTFCGLPVVPFEDVQQQYAPEDYGMFVAVGYRKVNRIRAALYGEAKAKGYRLITYVSSRCTNWASSIGDNCFIFEDNTVQPFVTIGNDVVLWSGNHIGHHSTIGDHCYVTSHVVISGHCKVGPYCFLGVNATLRDSIRIAESCVVGAGALIMKSTAPKQVFLGERSQPFAHKSDEIDL